MSAQRIVVTAEDIQNGNRNSTLSCPVALAFGAAFPDAGVRTFRYATIVNHGTEERKFLHPDCLVKSIEKFDWFDEAIPVGEYFCEEV